LPFIGWMPLTTASGVLSGFGRLEYRLHKPLRTSLDRGVDRASHVLDCQRDVPRVSRDLCGNQSN
jgi:hypothetical protein